MSNLILKPITDKNGVTTKRWVKPTDGGNASASAIPAPKAVSQADPMFQRQHKIVDLAETLYSAELNSDGENLYGDMPRVTVQGIQQLLGTMEDATLTALEKYMSPDDGDVISFFSELVLDDDATDINIRESAAFHDCFDEYPDIYRVTSFVNGLHSYEPFKDVDLSTLEGEQMEMARSFCKVANTIHTWLPESKSNLSTFPATKLYRHIIDKELVDLIIAHPTRGDDIVRFIQERDEADAGAIREYLYTFSAVAEGAL